MWSYVEVQMALVLSAIMKAQSEPAIAVFLSIRNSRAQRHAINAAAEVGLKGENLEVYRAISNVYKGLEAQRNDLVHGIFGFSEDIPDHVLWIDPKTHTNVFAQRIAKLLTPDEISADALKKDIYVYRLADLTGLRDQIQELCMAALMFSTHLRRRPYGAVRPDQQFQQLCALPQIQQELSRLKTVQQNTAESQQSPLTATPVLG